MFYGGDLSMSRLPEKAETAGRAAPQKRGAGALLPSGGGRKRHLPSLLIGIAITARDEGTKPMMNVCDPPVAGCDVEDTTRAHSDFAHVDPCFGATRDHCTHQIARLKPLHPLGSLWLATREPEPIDVAHLPAAMPRRHDLKRHHAFDIEVLWSASSDTRCIEPMGLGQPAPHAVVLRQAAAATFHG